MKTISIVIPVYNEADYLAACLQAIAKLRPAPLEVIVVDNNSTDDSAALASSYPFVKVLKESRQGVVHARNRGFNATRGDIIGRIDADTLLPVDWVKRLRQIFSDEEISAVSGSAHYYDFKFSKIVDNADGFCRRYLARNLKNDNYLWGANMALRRTSWQNVRAQLCVKPLIHEDFDLAIHLQQAGYQVAYDDTLVAGVSSRRIDSGFLAYMHYTLRSPQTYAVHNLTSQKYMYPVLALCWLAYVPGRLIYRGYDEAGNFSWWQLLAGDVPARVDPTAHVIS